MEPSIAEGGLDKNDSHSAHNETKYLSAWSVHFHIYPRFKNLNFIIYRLYLDLNRSENCDKMDFRYQIFYFTHWLSHDGNNWCKGALWRGLGL